MGGLQFFWVAMAGLGKYSKGGYSRIGVYKVNANMTIIHQSPMMQYLKDVKHFFIVILLSYTL